jgi:hypothetical protein
VVESRVEYEPIHEAVSRCEMVVEIVLSKPNVDDASRIVRTQVKCLLIGLDCFSCLELLRKGSSVLIPERMVSWVLFDPLKEVLSSELVIRLDKTEHTKCQQYLGILRLEHMRSLKRLLDFVVFKLVVILDSWQLVIIRVVFEPEI